MLKINLTQNEDLVHCSIKRWKKIATKTAFWQICKLWTRKYKRVMYKTKTPTQPQIRFEETSKCQRNKSETEPSMQKNIEEKTHGTKWKKRMKKKKNERQKLNTRRLKKINDGIYTCIYRSLWLDGSVQCHRTPNLARNHANRISWAVARHRHLLLDW